LISVFSRTSRKNLSLIFENFSFQFYSRTFLSIDIQIDSNKMRPLFTSLLLVLSISLTKQQAQSECPIAQNPSQVFQCLTLNPQAFVDLISKNDFKSFCHMANGYMTCMSTYIRDCLGGKAASGILEELQDLNLKCCISPKVEECVIKSKRQFFSVIN